MRRNKSARSREAPLKLRNPKWNHKQGREANRTQTLEAYRKEALPESDLFVSGAAPPPDPDSGRPVPGSAADDG